MFLRRFGFGFGSGLLVRRSPMMPIQYSILRNDLRDDYGRHTVFASSIGLVRLKTQT